MSRVTRAHVRKHHISNQCLGQELGLDSIDVYVTRRQLGWLGHVRRMDFDRLPRRMLSAWVTSKRPPGAPTMTYGRTMHKALKKFDIEPEMWPALAADRGLWRETLKLGRPAVRRSLRQARR